MSANTTVGPAGAGKPANAAKKPDNHTPTKAGGFGQAQGQDAPDLTLNSTNGDVTPHADL